MLFNKADLVHPDEGRERLAELTAHFGVVVQDRGFPCMFAGTAYARGELLFGHVAVDADPLDGVLALLQATVLAIERNPAQVVVIFVDRPSGDLDTDRDLAADLLHHLRHNASQPWPESAPHDPEHPLWTFWFEGVGLFFNFSSPNHIRRRSRNVGPAFTIIVQARSSFDDFRQPGDRSRASIRTRLAEYDDIGRHPALGTYGDPQNREAHQYFLGDTNDFVTVIEPVDGRNGSRA